MVEKLKMSAGLAGALLFYGVGIESATAGELERALDYRQGVMNVFSWNMKSMGDMMKGKKPYDSALFARHADDLAKAASLDLLAGFPPDSDQGESDARPDIWFDFEDFSQKLADLRDASQALRKAVASGDKAAIGDALGKTGKRCKACHKSYKD
ncbi:MAG: cytochrome c [Candidatus Thiodiazotropha sp.]